MRSEFFRIVSTLIFITLFSLFYSQPSKAQITQPREKGIWLSREANHKLTSEQEQLLIASLRRITGLQQLAFTSNGALNLGEPTSYTKGSQTARAILQQTLASGSMFILENHSNSQTVNFGQLDEGLHYENTVTLQKFMIWCVRIDFDDFRTMQTSAEVREAFDSGFTLLHELLHALGHKDPANVGEIGECEEIINQMRTELRLPTREHYHGVPVMQVHPQTVTVRVQFRERIGAKVTKVAAPARWKTHYLYFLMAISDESSSALLGLQKRRKN